MSTEILELSNSQLAEHERMAKELVAETRAHGGLAPCDLDRFWAEQKIAVADPFGSATPQVPLRIMMSWECVFDELGIEENPWRFLNDTAWANQCIDQYNSRARDIVGRDLLTPRTDPIERDTWPKPREFCELFDGRNVWHGNSWWLEQAANTPDDLRALLDRVDTRLSDIRAFVIPPAWDERKQDLLRRKIRPPLYRSQRGPVTFATSIYGAENLLMLIMLEPELAGRLRDTILKAMLAYGELFDTEAGLTRENAPRGFSFMDDNCCLLSPDMYKFFGLPILKAMFERYAPNQKDWRYQHSDSAMGHLLPLLAPLNFTQVNFGPTLSASLIRSHMPRTVIEGQLAPFTFSRNEEEKMVCEFLRDFTMTRKTRGLYFGTAGSINNGSRLSGMRLIMDAIQKYGRYDS